MADWPILPGGIWTQGNLTLGSTTGVTVTASATANTKGATTTLMADTGAGGSGLLLSIADNSANARYLLDIMAGSTVLVPDIPLAYPRANQAGQLIYLPIAVPPNVTLGARCQSSTASATLSVMASFVAMGSGAPPSPQVVTAYGVVSGTTNGTQLDPGATANSATIVQIAASTSAPMRQAMIVLTARANTAMTTARWLLRLMAGPSGQEQAITPRVAVAANTTDDDIEPSVIGPLPVPTIPAGTRLTIAIQCSITDATDRLLDAVVYGIA